MIRAIVVAAGATGLLVVARLCTSWHTIQAPTVTVGSASISTAGGPSTAIPARFFGISVLDFRRLSPTMLFGTTRSWDAGPGLDWSDANPSPGVYNFSLLDRFIAFNQARSSEGIYTFGRTPRWASSQPDDTTSPYGPGECAPPSKMSYWDDYVTAIVTHAGGRIKYWELWNEPNETDYCGDIPTMVTMAQHAYRIIKVIDPTAVVLTPSTDKASGPSWLSSFLSRGGARSVDVIAFHGYWSAEAEDIVAVVTRFQAVAAANGLSNLPLWDTESSWAYTSSMPLPPLSEQVGYIAKCYLLHWSLGVTRFAWYAYDANSPWGTLHTYSGETAAAFSYRETYRWMVGATLTSPCSETAQKIWSCPLSRPGNYSAEAVWISNSSAMLTVPKQYTQYLDLAGVTHAIKNGAVIIGDQPMLLQTGPLPR
jgi:hypothetical protein